MKKTYWNGKGEYQKDYKRLSQALVPGSGKASTIEGELLRNIGNVYYDYYNNGFCNFDVLRGQVARLNRFLGSRKDDLTVKKSMSEDELEKIANLIIKHVLEKEKDAVRLISVTKPKLIRKPSIRRMKT